MEAMCCDCGRECSTDNCLCNECQAKADKIHADEVSRIRSRILELEDLVAALKANEELTKQQSEDLGMICAAVGMRAKDYEESEREWYEAAVPEKKCRRCGKVLCVEEARNGGDLCGCCDDFIEGLRQDTREERVVR